MTWDFVEPNPIGTSAGSFSNCVRSVAKTVGKLPASADAIIRQADSRELEYPQNSVIVTDPPYYDNIPYADISEYFYVWLRESLKEIWPTLTASLATPKASELTYDRSRHRGDAKLAREHFSKGFEETFLRWRERANSDYPSLVFYAFRATEKAAGTNGTSEAAVVSQGWESILSSLIGAKYQITGTWPIGTERSNRFRSIDSNALGSSIVLVCRPRPDDSPRCTRSDLLRDLRNELPPSVKRLRDANLAATDLEQAAIGPGMAAFSRYREVLEPDGSPMTVRSALAVINDELAQILLGEIADVDAETHFALAWFDGHFYDEATYGEAEVLLKAKNASLDALRDSGIVKAERGAVQLLRPRSIDAIAGPPSTDGRIRGIPAFAQLIYVIAALVAEDGGAEVAASMLQTIGSDNSERLKDIAYHCYLICDRAKRSSEAQDFNELIAAWPELQKRMGEQHTQVHEDRLI
jgi:putative DNA methylase